MSDLTQKKMKYLLMIYSDESLDENMSEKEMENLIEEYQTFSAGIISSGNFLGAEALQPSSTATCVRIDERKKVLPTDGPFIETKEQLGGFYLIEATDLDEATAIAARMLKHTVVNPRNQRKGYSKKWPCASPLQIQIYFDAICLFG